MKRIRFAPVLVVITASMISSAGDTVLRLDGGGRADSPEPAPSEERTAETLPDIVLIESMARYYGPVVFAHGAHAEMAAMSGGCSACHHGSAEGEPIEACRACHPDSPATATLRRPSLKGAYHRQCLGCHRDWAHENGCSYCHEERPSGSINRGDATDIIGVRHPRIHARTSYIYHTAHETAPVVTFQHGLHADAYDNRCVDCHRGESCSRCHDTTARTRDVEHMTSCRGCHVTNDCGFCHDQLERPPFDHAVSAQWSLQPHHEALKCTDCHGPVDRFSSPSPNCRSCHARLEPGSFDHATVTGVPLAGSHGHFTCERCHRDGARDASATCSGCHPQTTGYPQDLPGLRRHEDAQSAIDTGRSVICGADTRR